MRQAGELDLQLKEMEVVEIFLRIDFFFYLHSEFIIEINFFSTFQEDLKSAHNSLGRMERELWAAEDKNCPRRKAANPWQV